MTQPPAPPPGSVPHPRPRSRRDLFVAFTLLALQGFGGVLPVVQREMVERRRWMTQEDFVEEWAVAQTMPGPNVVNLSIVIGNRYFGVSGALAALAGMLLVPSLVVLALATVYAQFSDNPRVAGALRGMGAVTAGMIAATGIKLAATLTRHPLPLPVTATLAGLAIVALAALRLPMPGVLAVVGGIGCVLTWRRLTP
ncbi:chromate transporter [Pseudoduganella plicata]|uniref:Chromate transporter n=1 Tax=Pseudoduganella plicata TaxID=321984 RepID=A0A4P7BCV0_9BURK|nr:chromate transporter [Pseudoduganella plicata]QBQ35737.1 chromate transporter [Pseudoduganella plicata]GGY95517.1 chromate transporter [Pseudoduganella plicata]